MDREDPAGRAPTLDAVALMKPTPARGAPHDQPILQNAAVGVQQDPLPTWPWAAPPPKPWFATRAWYNVNTREVIEGVDVAVSCGRIAYIGNAAHCIGDGTRVIEADGRYLAPGFLDGHIHVRRP